MAVVLRERKCLATTTLDSEHALMWLHIPDIRGSIAVPIEQVDRDLRMHDAVVRITVMVDVFGGVHEARILNIVEAGLVAAPESEK